uniref:Uncharacterized protein n=1 Tax=Geospiza parvula TaxID=87175 RepID=A0A8U8BV35_GEOPR
MFSISFPFFPPFFPFSPPFSPHFFPFILQNSPTFSHLFSPFFSIFPHFSPFYPPKFPHFSSPFFLQNFPIFPPFILQNFTMFSIFFPIFPPFFPQFSPIYPPKFHHVFPISFPRFPRRFPLLPQSPFGVTVAVDSRATAGSYIALQSVLKVLPINPRILGTMAGGAADCSFWQRLVARQCRVQELRNKEPVSVAAASKLLANLVYQYKGMGLSLGTMVCGWDKRGPGLYYVDSEGQRVAAPPCGVLDRGLRGGGVGSERAARRGAAPYLGGTVRVFHVGESGWRQISADNVSELQELPGSEAKKWEFW